MFIDWNQDIYRQMCPCTYLKSKGLWHRLTIITQKSQHILSYNIYTICKNILQGKESATNSNTEMDPVVGVCQRVRLSSPLHVSFHAHIPTCGMNHTVKTLTDLLCYLEFKYLMLAEVRNQVMLLMIENLCDFLISSLHL